jgi:hypothetical protein
MRGQRWSASAQDIKSHYGNVQPYIHKHVFYYLASERIIIILYPSYSAGSVLRSFQVLYLIDKLNQSNGP